MDSGQQSYKDVLIEESSSFHHHHYKFKTNFTANQLILVSNCKTNLFLMFMATEIQKFIL